MRGIFIGAGIGFAFGLSTFAWSANNPPPVRDPTYRHLELFTDVLARVQAHYVTEVDVERAMEAAIDGMLTSLDPHSNYMNPAEFADSREQMSGEYTGLGIEVTMEEGLVKVVSPFDDTPAARAGVQPGDYITAVNGVSIVGLPLSDAVRSLRGEVGTSVTITIARGEAGETLDLTLARDRVQSRAVSHRVEGTDIGYLRVAAFNERTTDALQRSLRALRSEMGSRMRGIVIDLRNNPGGYLDQAVNVADAFLDGGEVVSTRGRDGLDFGRYGAKPGTLVPDIPVVVIINGASASAAEVVAGALQDRERATIIGMRSFGKGSVQSEITLGAQRGALRLTTSRYYTPSGRSIQGTGITPDLEIAQQRLTDEEIRRINLRSEATLPNALENESGEAREGPHIPAEMPPEGYAGEDYQLERALQIVREKADAGRRLASRASAG